MQNLGTLQTTGLSLELFHVQTDTSFELPPNLAVIRIGKPNDQIQPDIDVSRLPDDDIVSRVHAEIQVEENTYYIVDVGSSNGTLLNDVKLEPRQRYPLILGDKINLGQEEKVTFIFQYKRNFVSSSHGKLINHPTVLQPQIAANAKPHQVDRSSKFVGLALMVAGIVIFGANTQIGIFVGIPSVLLLIAGVGVLVWRSEYRNLGWILIGVGIAIMLFSGNLFASVNLLSILVSSALLVVGYQLCTTGKVLNYSLRSLKGLLKK